MIDATPPPTADSNSWLAGVVAALAAALGFAVRHLAQAVGRREVAPAPAGAQEVERLHVGINGLVAAYDRLAAVQEKQTALLENMHQHLILESERARDHRADLRERLRELGGGG